MSEALFIRSYHKKLHQHGLRATNVQLAVLRLLDVKHGPFSAKEVHAELNFQGNLTTIYRALEKFVEKGIAVECDFNDGQVRYELSGDEHGHHHHHLICRSCSDWISVDACVDSSSLVKLEKSGYSQITHRLEFFGVCPDCSV